jgi:hypothetical protein
MVCPYNRTSHTVWPSHSLLVTPASIFGAKVIILDNLSSVDVFCNPDFATNLTRSPRSKHLIGNGGLLTAHLKAQIPGYHQDVCWFCKKAVTNIIGLRNLTKQFRVQYDCDNQIFVVDRTPYGLPAMNFCLHSCGGLYSYFTPPEGKPFSFGTPAEAISPPWSSILSSLQECLMNGTLSPASPV